MTIVSGSILSYSDMMTDYNSNTFVLLIVAELTKHLNLLIFIEIMFHFKLIFFAQNIRA